MAAKVNFDLYLNSFLSPELFGARNVAHICPIKFLLTYLYPKTMTLCFIEINVKKSRFAYLWILQLNSMFEDFIGAHMKLQNGRLTMLWGNAG